MFLLSELLLAGEFLTRIQVAGSGYTFSSAVMSSIDSRHFFSVVDLSKAFPERAANLGSDAALYNDLVDRGKLQRMGKAHPTNRGFVRRDRLPRLLFYRRDD